MEVTAPLPIEVHSKSTSRTTTSTSPSMYLSLHFKGLPLPAFPAFPPFRVVDPSSLFAGLKGGEGGGEDPSAHSGRAGKEGEVIVKAHDKNPIYHQQRLSILANPKARDCDTLSPFLRSIPLQLPLLRCWLFSRKDSDKPFVDIRSAKERRRR